MRTTLAVALLLAALIPTQAQALDNEELLALVAMPLAVAAVSEVTDVPMNDLIDVVSLMNDALVPPAQFIEVVRYAPVALVVDTQEPRFPAFVQGQFDNGLRGTELVNSIENRFQIYGVEGVDLDVVAPRVIDIEDNFVPQIVRTRIAERKAHPHGGPPGQVKKSLGVQTGAEVVHGTRKGKGNDRVAKVEKKERKAKRSDDKHVSGRGHGKGKGKGKG